MRLHKNIGHNLTKIVTGLVLGLAVFASGCQKMVEDKRELIAYVPADTVVTVRADWQKVRNAAVLRRLLKDGWLDNQLKQMGLAPEKVSDVVLFSQGKGSLRDGQAALIRGDFTATDVTNQLKAKNWQVLDVDGRKIYSSSTLNVAATDEDTLVLGAMGAVKESLATRTQNAPSLLTDAGLNEINTTLAATNHPVQAVLSLKSSNDQIPVGRLNSFLEQLGLGALAPLTEYMKEADAIGLAAGQESSKVKTEIAVMMKDRTSAGLLAAAVKGLSSTASLVGGSSISPELLTALQTANVGYSVGRVVTLDITLPANGLTTSGK